MEAVRTGSSNSDRTGPDTQLLAAGQRLGRYEVLERVGAGGMGVVYKARDTVRGNLVALKTLHNMDPRALVRLKNEFRYVSNVTHPNLVSLHEMGQVDDTWFFTMEFIQGESLWDKLRRGILANVPPQASSQEDATVTGSAKESSQTPVSTQSDATVTSAKLSPDDPVAPPSNSVQRARPALPEEELRRVFRQLALATFALHSSRKLHCDIKPRNVMVAEDGRVVLLDFGLASDRAETSSSELAGTPAYMSPEQLLGQPASEATDWYAFGVMLYEALAGGSAFPHRGAQERTRHTPPPLVPTPLIPEELRTLAMDLVQLDPAHRPTGREVLARLGLETGAQAAPQAQSLIGRQGSLESLVAAYDAVASGKTVVVHLHAPSGLGKTSLVRGFAERLGNERPGSVVLHGRCYERESVPYKGFDSLIDSLTRYLRTLPSSVVQPLVPEHLPELIRIFPVLRQVEALSQVAPSTLGAGKQLQELRLRAFRGLKELLANLGRKAPLVLHLDDLQWGDPDTVQALSELQEAPGVPRMLLLCSYRTGEGVAAGLLEAHRKLAQAPGSAIDLREVALAPLSEAESLKLAAELLKVPETDPRAITIAREGHGSPFFIEELAQYTQERGGASLTHDDAATLEKVVLARVAKLAPEPGRLLSVVAVAGQPVPQGLAFHAAAVSGDPHMPWTVLRAAHLVTTHGPRDEDTAECYHDRIREIVFSSLSPETMKAHHLRLAELLETTGSADPERLARHFRGAGRLDKAGPYAVMAAERAASALAFERAAALYAEALECIPDDAKLMEAQADALVNASRGAEAAPLYLKAAALERGDRAFDLRRRGAEQYLVSGRLGEGVALIKDLLAEVELPYPATNFLALVGVIFRSIQFQLFGKNVRSIPAAEVPPLLRKQISVTWSAARGLAVKDMLRMGYFTVRTALLAAEAGDGVLTAYGLLALAAVTFSRGSPGDVQRGTRILEDASRRVEALNNPALTGFLRSVRGQVALSLGRWRQSDELLTESIRLLEDKCTGVLSDLDQTYSCRVYVLRMLGNLKDLAAIGNRWLRFSEQNKNQYAASWMQIHLTPARLAEDDPGSAMVVLAEMASGWSRERFTPQNFYAVMECARCELYQGEPAKAWERLERVWPVAKANFMLGQLYFLIFALRLRAGTALAMAESRPAERERFLAAARKDIQALEGMRHREDAQAEAGFLRAAEAALLGRTEEALQRLDTAVAAFNRLDMPLHAACAMRRKGQLSGAEAGAKLIAEADTVLRNAGVRSPERWTRLEAPGFAAP